MSDLVLVVAVVVGAVWLLGGSKKFQASPSPSQMNQYSQNFTPPQAPEPPKPPVPIPVFHSQKEVDEAFKALPSKEAYDDWQEQYYSPWSQGYKEYLIRSGKYHY